MGICTSCHSTPVTSAKLILPNGSLQEFFYPTKVSEVLRNNPSTFICNSDEMEFDDVVLPMKDYEELQPDQLYFALPLKWLSRPIQPEEMAALAVKASAALAKCGQGGACGRGENVYFTTSFSGEKRRVRSSSKVADVCGGRKRQNFKSMLTVIPE